MRGRSTIRLIFRATTGCRLCGGPNGGREKVVPRHFPARPWRGSSVLVTPDEDVEEAARCRSCTTRMSLAHCSGRST